MMNLPEEAEEAVIAIVVIQLVPAVMADAAEPELITLLHLVVLLMEVLPVTIICLVTGDVMVATPISMLPMPVEVEAVLVNLVIQMMPVL